MGRAIAALGRARDAIDDPALHAPPPTERVLAEGYRYLLGWVHGAFERAFHADPRARTSAAPSSRSAASTIDNADALYLNAEIDGDAQLSSAARRRLPHWRGERRRRGSEGAALRDLRGATDYAGDSGTIAELRPGRRAGTGTLDSSRAARRARTVRFEILLAPERPAGHAGNFIATTRVRPRRSPAQRR